MELPSVILVFIVVTVTSSAIMGVLSFKPYVKHEQRDQYLGNSFFQAVADAMNKDYINKYLTNEDQFDADVTPNNADVVEDFNYISGEDDDSNIVPSLRDIEYLQRNNLWRHQYVTGGAGEGKQRLKPAGTVPNKNDVKTDAILPAYCNPPNPCPIGFTAEDGCIEDFQNTASFSRTYQAAQKCMCDAEHMFDCPNGHESPYDESNVKRRNYNFYQKQNPYLAGEKLPIAAKKGIDVIY